MSRHLRRRYGSDKAAGVRLCCTTETLSSPCVRVVNKKGVHLLIKRKRGFFLRKILSRQARGRHPHFLSSLLSFVPTRVVSKICMFDNFAKAKGTKAWRETGLMGSVMGNPRILSIALLRTMTSRGVLSTDQEAL